MKVGLLGFGTVGIGVDEITENRKDISVVSVLTRTVKEGIGDRMVSSIDDIVNNPEIDTVVEVMGGIEPAHEYAVKALKAGKNFVTANKALVAAHYKELVTLANENHVSFRCTASAGGGIPWLYNLERVKRVDNVSKVGGIMNGTTNYIMTKMNNENADFDETLKKAQELGYAEADPSADIDGYDIRRKLNISANVAFDSLIAEEDIPCFGIRNVTAIDIANGKQNDMFIKLIATAEENDGAVACFVEPTFISKTDLLAGVEDTFNLVFYTGNNCGTQSFVGRGAGRFPTAYNVVQDLVDIECNKPSFYTSKMKEQKVDNTKVVHPYYVRTTMPDGFLQKNTEKSFGTYVVTRPISVKEMHEWAKEQLKVDPKLFICAM